MSNQDISDPKQILIASGDIERLKELLKLRLIECGWRDEMKAHCKSIVRDRGVANVTLDELVKEISEHGRKTIPDSVKLELLQQLRYYLELKPDGVD